MKKVQFKRIYKFLIGLILTWAGIDILIPNFIVRLVTGLPMTFYSEAPTIVPLMGLGVLLIGLSALASAMD